MTLPVLPMGTLMAAAMLIGALFLALPVPGLVAHRGARDAPGMGRVAARTAGIVVALAGLWQLLWYVPRHATTGWGLAASLSGALLLAAAGMLLSSRARAKLLPWRWLLVAGLAVMAALYGVTIARL